MVLGDVAFEQLQVLAQLQGERAEGLSERLEKEKEAAAENAGVAEKLKLAEKEAEELREQMQQLKDQHSIQLNKVVLELEAARSALADKEKKIQELTSAEHKALSSAKSQIAKLELQIKQDQYIAKRTSR